MTVKNYPCSEVSNLSNWKEEAWKKKTGLQRDSNPWPPRYQCDALPTSLWSHTLGARSFCWVHIFPWLVKWCKYIWNNSYIWTAVIDDSEELSLQWIFQFKQLERRSLKKKTGLQRDSNPWPPRYRCDALPTELWSHTLEARSFCCVHIFPWGVKWCKYIWNNSYI